jgi:hypothetical protein
VSAYAIHILHAGGWSQAQCEQFIRRVCLNAAPQLEKPTLAQYHVTEAFMNHAQNRRAEVRRHVGQAIKYSPRWALDRGVQSISVDAVAGPYANRLRSTARRAPRHKE